MYRSCLLELGHILICTCKVTKISDFCNFSYKNIDILYKNHLQKVPSKRMGTSKGLHFKTIKHSTIASNKQPLSPHCRGEV